MDYQTHSLTTQSCAADKNKELKSHWDTYKKQEKLTSSMSMMIMFGVETFVGFSVSEQHIIAQKRVRVRADITRIAVLKSYEHQLRGSGLFVFMRVFSATVAHTQQIYCFEVFLL